MRGRPRQATCKNGHALDDINHVRLYITKDGYELRQCITCHNRRVAEWRLRHLDEFREYQRDYQRDAYHKTNRIERIRKHREAHREEYNEYQREYWAKNKERLNKLRRRAYRAKKQRGKK